MGFLDKLTGKKEEMEQEKKEPAEEVPLGKYAAEECSLCGDPGSDKKWAGQYWHKRCVRLAKKQAKKML